jgi:hypothetical protein
MPSRVTSRSEPVIPRSPRPSDMPAAADARARARSRPPPPPPSLLRHRVGGPKSRQMAWPEAALRRPLGEAGEPWSARRRWRRNRSPPARLATRRAGRRRPPRALEDLEDEMASPLGRPKSPS